MPKLTKSKNKSTKKKITKHLPTKSQPSKNTTAYYQCMCDSSKQGLNGKKITQVAHACKVNSPAILNKRTQQIKTLSKAYKQLGTALDSLIK